MRYPQHLPKGGTIGFVAPAFGCAIEPYRTRFDNALTLFRGKGFKTSLGPNCYEDKGVGISNLPALCGEELTRAMTDENLDAVISCGGGELMCEVLPFIDFEAIKNAPPKWYMGYSDNTNFTFLSATLADTAAIYGPCAPAFGRVPWDASVQDAFDLLKGTTKESHGYPMWEAPVATEGEPSPYSSSTPDPIEPYSLNTKTLYRYFLPEEADNPNHPSMIHTGTVGKEIRLQGRLLGGCLDILTMLCGTKYDKTKEFVEKYKDDGILWFLESCDLTPLDMRRAFWQLREAGWFEHASGFLIGRPLHFGEEMMGVDQYNAVTDVLRDLNLPILMDLDIGHLPPMMPLICGSTATVKVWDQKIRIRYTYE